MNTIKKIINGMLIGISSIVPGISGSMVATILNVYEDLIEALNKFIKTPLKAIFSVWEYILGVIIGLFLGFFLISYVFEVSPLILTLLFIGFILGSVPNLLKEIKITKTTYKHVITFIITVLVMIAMLLIQEKEGVKVSFIYVFIIGLITSSALIVPGLSGATLLLALGFYQTLLTMINNLINAFVTFNKETIIQELPLFLILVLGVIVGLVIMGKIMFYIIKNKKKHFQVAILAIALVSPITIFFTLNKQYDFNVKWHLIVLGIIMLITGSIVSNNILSKKEKTYNLKG